MNDDPKPPPEQPNPPDPPKPSKVFTMTRSKKGRLSQKKGARRKQKDVHQEDAADPSTASSALPADDGINGEPPAATSSSSLRSQIEARGAKRKILAREYKSELTHVYAEIDASQASLNVKDSEIDALKKRNTTLASQLTTASDAVRRSRSTAREAHTSARESVKEASSEANILSQMLKKAEAELAQARLQIATKEAEMQQQAADHKVAIEVAIRQSVDDGKEKAKVCSMYLHFEHKFFLSSDNANYFISIQRIKERGTWLSWRSDTSLK
jgi:chromosome segregation ATPase